MDLASLLESFLCLALLLGTLVHPGECLVRWDVDAESSF
jgi:hypothetical protein